MMEFWDKFSILFLNILELGNCQGKVATRSSLSWFSSILSERWIARSSRPLAFSYWGLVQPCSSSTPTFQCRVILNRTPTWGYGRWFSISCTLCKLQVKCKILGENKQVLWMLGQIFTTSLLSDCRLHLIFLFITFHALSFSRGKTIWCLRRSQASEACAFLIKTQNPSLAKVGS